MDMVGVMFVRIIGLGMFLVLFWMDYSDSWEMGARGSGGGLGRGGDRGFPGED